MAPTSRSNACSACGWMNSSCGKVTLNVSMWLPARLAGLLPRYRGHATRIGTSISVDRQQRVHRACDGDERPANAAGGAKIRKIFADVRYGQSIDIHIIADSRAIGVISRVQSLLPF